MRVRGIIVFNTTALKKEMIMLKRKKLLHPLVFFYNFIAKKIKMGLFDKKIAKKVEQERTTSGFFIGAAEAEGEANNTKITLSEVFEDFLAILSQLNNEKFIVTGRKGSGKSAIGEYLYSIAYNEPNLFATFIKKIRYRHRKNCSNRRKTRSISTTRIVV